MFYDMGGQIAARGPNMARHSVLPNKLNFVISWKSYILNSGRTGKVHS